MPKMPSLAELSTDINIANYLNDNTLLTIGARVVNEYESDLQSRSEWEKMYRDALKSAQQVTEQKSFPWPGAANVKYPIISMASIQFASRAYPEIVQHGRVAGCKVIGKDPTGEKQDRADRVSKHMSYQLCEEIENWDEETDKLLHILPISGMCWRKTYYCPILGARSDMINPLDVVVHYYTKSLDTCSRITHIFPLTANDIVERVRASEYIDADLGTAVEDENYASSEYSVPHIFLEQHRYWDLDGDGYEEPYIVTVHKDTGKVMRIVARYDETGIVMHEGKVLRIAPINYFTKYSFIPALDGSFYDIGFGVLMSPVNDTINTLINQLIDAGTLANTGGGFLGKGARIPGGRMEFAPGEWKYVDAQGGVLRDAIVPKPTTQPSPVLFQMLGMMIDVAKQISTVSEEMTGQQTSPNETATSTLARVEQGMKMFSAIHKRIYKSITSELKKLYRINRLYLPGDKYINIVDDELADAKADYEDDSIDIRPIADPSMSTDVQRLMRIQAAQQIVAMIPGGNMAEIGKRSLEALHIDDPDKLLPDPNAEQPPDPKMIEAQMRMQMLQAESQARLAEKQAEMQLKAGELAAKSELEQMRFESERQVKQMELQIKHMETQAKIEADMLRQDREDMLLDIQTRKYESEVEARREELERQAELQAMKLDNDMKFNEHKNMLDLVHQRDIKDLDSKDLIEENNANRESIKTAAQMMAEMSAKHAAPKKIIRNDKGIITHIGLGDELREVVRDANGNIESII